MSRTLCTVIPVSQYSDIDELASVTSKWIYGSPHNESTAEVFDGIDKGNFNFYDGEIIVDALRVTSEDTDIWALRFKQDTETELFTSEIVGHKSKYHFNVSVALHYETLEIGKKRKNINKPRIINEIIAQLTGGEDGHIIVKDSPYWISHDDLDIVASIMELEGKNMLPIVYLSRNNFNWSDTNPKKAAQTLAGMAHVFVEPDRDFSFKLKDKTGGKNAYLGAVGIHWPDGFVKRILPDDNRDPIKQVYECLCEHSIHTLLPRELMFDGVKSLRFLDEIKEIKQVHEADLDDLLDQSIEEIERKDQEIESLKKQFRLREVELLKQAAHAGHGSGCLNQPQVIQLYDGETRDMLVGALIRANNNSPENCREHDMINAVIAENEPTGEKDRIIKELKSIFKGGARSINASMKSRLNRLGLEVENKGAHPAIYVPGYEDRKVIMSASASDGRAGKNAVKEIKKKLL